MLHQIFPDNVGGNMGFQMKELRGTDLSTISSDILEKLPLNNLDCDRDLDVMDKIATRAATCATLKFTGQGMRDDMTKIDSETKNVLKLMDANEKQWLKSSRVADCTHIAPQLIIGIAIIAINCGFARIFMHVYCS